MSRSLFQKFQGIFQIWQGDQNGQTGFPTMQYVTAKHSWSENVPKNPITCLLRFSLFHHSSVCCLTNMDKTWMTPSHTSVMHKAPIHNLHHSLKHKTLFCSHVQITWTNEKAAPDPEPTLFKSKMEIVWLHFGFPRGFLLVFNLTVVNTDSLERSLLKLRLSHPDAVFGSKNACLEEGTYIRRHKNKPTY